MNPLMVKQAEHFAALLREGSSDLSRQVKLAYRVALGREPHAGESRTLAAYAETHGLENMCRVILNSNEFMFVD